MRTAFLCLFLLAFPALAEHATTDVGRAKADGTGAPDCSALWRVGLDGKWAKVTSGETPERNGIFARWDSERSHYVWVTPADHRPILVGSKVEGRRLGQTGGMVRLAAEGWVADTDASHAPNLSVINRMGNREIVWPAPPEPPRTIASCKGCK